MFKQAGEKKINRENCEFFSTRGDPWPLLSGLICIFSKGTVITVEVVIRALGWSWCREPQCVHPVLYAQSRSLPWSKPCSGPGLCLQVSEDLTISTC